MGVPQIYPSPTEVPDIGVNRLAARCGARIHSFHSFKPISEAPTHTQPELRPLLLYFIFTCASLKPSHALLLIPFPFFFGPHFYISLPGAANRPFQIPLCPGTKAAQMWEGLALGKLTALSS